MDTLSTADPESKATKDARLAFWINTYNAVTVKGILREYPTTSIKNHVARLIGYNIWKDLLVYVGDEAISLDDIEHRVLRKMGEPRIHFAIVCASIGCPRLLSEAYTKERLSKQLELNSKDFFSRKQNFQYDSVKKTFAMSSILKWFGTDFGANQAAQLKTISKWLPNESAKDAALQNTVKVNYLAYNWKLNEKK